MFFLKEARKLVLSPIIGDSAASSDGVANAYLVYTAAVIGVAISSNIAINRSMQERWPLASFALKCLINTSAVALESAGTLGAIISSPAAQYEMHKAFSGSRY